MGCALFVYFAFFRVGGLRAARGGGEGVFGYAPGFGGGVDEAGGVFVERGDEVQAVGLLARGRWG